MFDEAEVQAEREAAGHIVRLKSLELKLFGFVLVVLLLEAVFVINPAVRKIRLLMKEMGRSHEELKSYAVKLERSNRELQDFASVAAHDLQEPLRKVQAFSDRLKTKYSGSFDDQGRDYLDRVQNAARRMQTLINDLLTYARVSTRGAALCPHRSCRGGAARWCPTWRSGSSRSRGTSRWATYPPWTPTRFRSVSSCKTSSATR